jgi:predicted dehydrogenase
LDELAADPQVEAVWIASPNHLHARMGLACIEAGKHVLIEKPMATTESDACKLVDAARRKDVMVHVGFHQRFRPAHQYLADLVERGDLGKLGMVRLHHFYRYPSHPSPWRASLTESGGWAINDVGSHLLDLLVWIGAAPARVVGAALATQRFAVETDETDAVLLTIGDQGIGIMATSTALDGAKSRIELYGMSGWARAEGTWAGGGFIETGQGDRVDFEVTPATDPFQAQLRDFLAAIDGGPSIGADVEAGLENVRLVEQALRAAGKT